MFGPYRNWHNDSTDISQFCFEKVEQGDLLVFKSYGKGEALDDPKAKVGLPTALTDVPAGIAANSTVKYDRSKWWTDTQARQELHAGSKMVLIKHGECQLDNIDPTVDKATTTFGGKKAYWIVGGKLTPIPNSSTPIGQFLSEPDDNGMVKVAINLR